MIPLQSTIADSTAMLALAVIVFGAYSAVLAYIGYQSYKNSEGYSDFILGAGGINGFVIGVSFAATYASANMFLGVPGQAYTYGTPVLWWTTLGFGLPFLATVAFGKRFWLMSKIDRHADMTLPEWIAKRFNSDLLRVGSAILSLFLVFYVTGQFVGAAIMFDTIFGLNYTTGLVLTFLIITFYVVLGGMDATILTDFVQGISMAIIAVAVFVSGIWVFDGLDFMWTIVDQLRAIDPTLVGVFAPGHIQFGGPVAILSISWLLIAFILMPHLMNRILAVGNKQELRKFIFGAGIGLFIFSAFMVWAGLAARVLFPNLESADSAVPHYIAYAFPEWATILIVVGILSAILTTADSLMHAVTTIIANDIYKHGIAKYLTSNSIDTKLVNNRATWVGRAGVVLVGGAAMLVALDPPESLFLLTQVGIAGLLSGTAVPVIAGYTWNGVTKRGAELSFFVGAIIYVVLFIGFVGPWGNNQFMSLLVASGGGTVAIIIGSLMTTDTEVSQQQNEAFRTADD